MQFHKTLQAVHKALNCLITCFTVKMWKLKNVTWNLAKTIETFPIERFFSIPWASRLTKFYISFDDFRAQKKRLENFVIKSSFKFQSKQFNFFFQVYFLKCIDLLHYIAIFPRFSPSSLFGECQKESKLDLSWKVSSQAQF